MNDEQKDLLSNLLRNCSVLKKKAKYVQCSAKESKVVNCTARGGQSLIYFNFPFVHVHSLHQNGYHKSIPLELKVANTGL